MSGTLNPFESLKDAIAFSSADWAQTQHMAWVYGIVLGWDADPGEDENGAMDDLAKRFRWNAETVARLRHLHGEFRRAETAYAAKVPEGATPDDAAEWWTPPMRTPLGKRIRGLFEHPCDGGVYSEDGYDHRGPIVTVRNLLRSARLAERELEARDE